MGQQIEVCQSIATDDAVQMLKVNGSLCDLKQPTPVLGGILGIPDILAEQLKKRDNGYAAVIPFLNDEQIQYFRQVTLTSTNGNYQSQYSGALVFDTASIQNQGRELCGLANKFIDMYGQILVKDSEADNGSSIYLLQAYCSAKTSINQALSEQFHQDSDRLKQSETNPDGIDSVAYSQLVFFSVYISLYDRGGVVIPKGNPSLAFDNTTSYRNPSGRCFLFEISPGNSIEIAIPTGFAMVHRDRFHAAADSKLKGPTDLLNPRGGIFFVFGIGPSSLADQLPCLIDSYLPHIDL
jgi:hypothetical protein